MKKRLEKLPPSPLSRSGKASKSALWSSWGEKNTPKENKTKQQDKKQHQACAMHKYIAPIHIA